MPEHDDECEHDGKDHDDDPRHCLTPIQDDLRPSAPGRAGGPGLTENLQIPFDKLWSETAESLDALLRARGLAAQDRADVMQEVAVHALRAHADGTITTSFHGWCKAVARNTVVAMHRRDRWIDLTDELEVEAHEDVEYHVEQRLELDAFASVWRTLDPDQRALLVDVDAPVDRAARNRHYVALHRLRKHVRHLTESALLGLSTIVYAARRRSTSGLAAAGMGAIGIVATVTIGVAGIQQHPPTEGEQKIRPSDFGSPAIAAPQGVEPTTDAAPRATDDHVVDAALPAGHRAEVWSREPEQADEPLVCAGTPGRKALVCISHPLRRDAAGPVATFTSGGES